MTYSLVDTLAQHLSKKLGLTVLVSREGTGGSVRYFIFVPGCHPSHFGPFTVDVAKRVLAMQSDMLSSGVIGIGLKAIQVNSEDEACKAWPSSHDYAERDAFKAGFLKAMEFLNAD